MKNIIKLLAIIALVTVIGFSFAACGDWGGSGGGGYGNGEGGVGGNGVRTAPRITISRLSSGTITKAYSQTLTAEGSTPITWSIDAGSLPDGLTLSTAGVISGTPTTAEKSNFTVKATNDLGSSTSPLSIVIGDMIWTAVTDSTISQFSEIVAVVYGGGKFVAGGGSGKMAYSEDGVTWTSVADSKFGTSYINAITYGDGRFVAVGGSGKIAYSDNGVIWTAVADSTFPATYTSTIGDYNSTFPYSISAIAYGDGRFVAGGQDGKTAYSDGGESWTAVSSKFRSYIRGIAYGSTLSAGGRFVAVGGGAMVDSRDGGETWYGEFYPSAFDTSDIRAIAYGSTGSTNKFVAVGSGGKIAYSTSDGMNWTPVADSTFGTSTSDGTAFIQAVAYGSTGSTNRFVAVGNAGKMAYSGDGINWTAVSDSGFGTSRILAIAYGGGRWVAVGEYGKMAYCVLPE
jgi:hypothetical protein